MKLTIFVVNILVVLGSPITPSLPDKLRQYRRATGISETELLTVYENHLSGNFAWLGWIPGFLGFCSSVNETWIWVAQIVISNDTKPKPIPWELSIKNLIFNFFVGVWVGGHSRANFSHISKDAQSWNSTYACKNDLKYSFRKKWSIIPEISTYRHSTIWRCPPRSIWNRASKCRSRHQRWSLFMRGTGIL